MKRALLMTVVLLVLLPGIAKAQWTFDIVSVEAYINDHKKQRSLLLARSTMEYSNKLLHEYSRKGDRRVQGTECGLGSLHPCLRCHRRDVPVLADGTEREKHLYGGQRPYRRLQETVGGLQRENRETGTHRPRRCRDTIINEKAIRDIANDGEQLYKSVSDLVLYATGAAPCSTSDLLLVLEAVNTSLDDIERHSTGRISRHGGTYRCVSVTGKRRFTVPKVKEIIDGAFGRWRKAGRLDY